MKEINSRCLFAGGFFNTASLLPLKSCQQTEFLHLQISGDQSEHQRVPTEFGFANRKRTKMSEAYRRSACNRRVRFDQMRSHNNNNVFCEIQSIIIFQVKIFLTKYFRSSEFHKNIRLITTNLLELVNYNLSRAKTKTTYAARIKLWKETSPNQYK